MINLLLVVLAFFSSAQTVPPAPTVKLAWDVYPLARPSNTGWYNVWRVAKPTTDDFCPSPTDYKWIGHVKQAFDAQGNASLPTFVDSTPLQGRACYTVSFIQTPSGTPTSVETERSDPVVVEIVN